jgi:Na+-translocating ferredoxin:NAD+ oxidoreductase subunit B
MPGDAVTIDDRLDVSLVNLDRCIGCGNCVTTCPAGAMALVKKDTEVVPPEDSEDLYETIMVNKKGKLGTIKLATRLMLKK